MAKLSEEERLKRLEKRKQTNLKRYGTEFPCRLKKFKDKAKQTNIKKYGTPYTFQSEAVKEKIKKTNLEKYGVENPALLKEINEKAKQTCLKKYGVTSTALIPEIKAKQIETLKQNYGVENAMYSKEIREKIKKTNLERYGSETPFHNASVQEKVKQTNLARYGTLCTLHTPETKEKVHKKNLENLGVKYPLQNETCLQKFKNTVHSNTYNSIVTLCKKNNNKVEPLFTKEEYKGSGYDNIYTWKCNECGSTFEFYYANGKVPVCRNCHPKSISKGQEEVIAHVKSFYNGEVLINDRTVIKPLELDIYIPELKLAIEYNGEYWHSLYEEGYHQFKLDRCKVLGIKLIYIWDSKWMKDGVKREVYKNLINKLLCHQ